MRLVHLIACPSPTDGSRKTRRKVMLAGAIPDQHKLHSRLMSHITRGRDQGKISGAKAREVEPSEAQLQEMEARGEGLVRSEQEELTAR